MSEERVASRRSRRGERLSVDGVAPLNKATGKPEITWFKAIQGNDSFYIVQVAFKAWPSKEQITQWMRYLKDATVCDTRLPDRACVAPGAGGPR